MTMDYEPSVCPNCGNDIHTPQQLAHCIELLTYRGECGVCGEAFGSRDEVAEMFWPGSVDTNPLPVGRNEDDDSIVCHAQCGISLGLAIA